MIEIVEKETFAVMLEMDISGDNGCAMANILFIDGIPSAIDYSGLQGDFYTAVREDLWRKNERYTSAVITLLPGIDVYGEEEGTLRLYSDKEFNLEVQRMMKQSARTEKCKENK